MIIFVPSDPVWVELDQHKWQAVVLGSFEKKDGTSWVKVRLANGFCVKVKREAVEYRLEKRKS